MGKGVFPKTYEVIQDLIEKQGDPFPADIKGMIEKYSWITAKSEWWPHQYLLRKFIRPEDQIVFNKAVEHVLEHGFDGQWFTNPRIYFYHDGLIYFFCRPQVMKDNSLKWHSVEEETIFNRSLIEQTFDYRNRKNMLSQRKFYEPPNPLDRSRESQKGDPIQGELF